MKILVLGSGRADRAADSIAEVLALRHEVTLFPFERGTAPFAGRLRRLNAVLQLGLRVAKKPSTHVANRWLAHWLRGKRFDIVLTKAVATLPSDFVAELRRLTGAW
ncbi:Hypothetical protein A7982_07496 [Minicystis rosea]|nr:Hypothetical protein A7982_07496 [Minicystis rosea]